ncbi:hypothetical protein MA16_Dca018251 [Dendrobium catenatum]|uniref:Reverse transcriptase domain-containing protein n=1 Tax=Dendrobium catenatum TaxID=906689 RepID=A0A2I0XBC1_9ASPA|nr:hypothetical protein MA16_Dca018251 [Dendrobium catenatum]
MDFRSISLCIFFSKLISKIIMIHLCFILPKIISPFLMGFVKGQAIIDNILLAQEFFHDLDVKVNGSNMILNLEA